MMVASKTRRERTANPPGDGQSASRKNRARANDIILRGALAAMNCGWPVGAGDDRSRAKIGTAPQDGSRMAKLSEFVAAESALCGLRLFAGA
jgi:hypothetical protein